MLKLKQVGTQEWEFVHPDGYDDTLDMLDKGCDLYRMGAFEQAENIFKGIVENMPDHLDGLHHWALIRDKSGDMAAAKNLWEQAVSMGRKAFPQDFTLGRDLLMWSFIDNRPFLRCMHGLGEVLFKTAEMERANKIFMEMLSLNPNDNQGIRSNVIGSFFYLAEPKEVLRICSSYPQDAMPDTLYGKALAFFQLGDMKKADSALKQAIKYLPKVAKELVKTTHKKPKFLYEGRVSAGGEDEAYAYWHRNNIHWESCIGARDWVKAALPGKQKSKTS